MQENKPLQTIITINPGWRYLAIAIFDDLGLREWRLKCLAPSTAGRKLEKVLAIVADFIKRYDPRALVVKRLHPARASANLIRLTKSITANCRQRGMTIFSSSIKDLENSLARGIRISKKDLIDLVAAEHPELAGELRREKRNRHPYFFRLFEAVALGHTYLGRGNDNH